MEGLSDFIPRAVVRIQCEFPSPGSSTMPGLISVPCFSLQEVACFPDPPSADLGG